MPNGDSEAQVETRTCLPNRNSHTEYGGVRVFVCGAVVRHGRGTLRGSITSIVSSRTQREDRERSITIAEHTEPYSARRMLRKTAAVCSDGSAPSSSRKSFRQFA